MLQFDQLCDVVAQGISNYQGLEGRLRDLERIRDFFAGLPWRPVTLPLDVAVVAELTAATVHEA